MKVCMLIDFVKSSNPQQILCTNHMLAGDRKGFSLYRSETGIPSRKQMIQDKLLDAEGINTLSDDQNLIEIKGLSLS